MKLEWIKKAEQNKQTYGKMMLALGIGLLVSICVSIMTGFTSDCAQIRESMLRLHILANSDTAEDQALKIKVRDRILEETGDLFVCDGSVEDAKQQAEEHLDDITRIAEEEIRKQGYDYSVKAELCNMFFETRQYEQFSLPAGRYDALRITIGAAEGHNWWCVLYPPLCLPAAMPEEELKNANLTQEQTQIIEQPQEYKVEFAVVELWEKLKNTFSDSTKK